MVNKLMYKFFIVIFFCFLFSSCIWQLFYKSPKPQKFALYKSNNIGLKANSTLKTNGFYYYIVTDRDFPGEKFFRYYRFLNNGEIRITGDITGVNPVEVYLTRKYAIDEDLDKSLYGYYNASNNIVEMEYVKEEREFLHKNYFYKSIGNLSSNGDTLYVKEQIYLNRNQTEQLNRVCLFYQFPK